MAQLGANRVRLWTTQPKLKREENFGLFRESERAQTINQVHSFKVQILTTAGGGTF